MIRLINTILLSCLMSLGTYGLSQPLLYRHTDYKPEFGGLDGLWHISTSFQFLPKENNGQLSLTYSPAKEFSATASFLLSNESNFQYQLSSSYRIKSFDLPGDLDLNRSIFGAFGTGLGKAGTAFNPVFGHGQDFAAKYFHGFVQLGYHHSSQRFGYEVFMRSIVIEYYALNVHSQLSDKGIIYFIQGKPYFLPQTGGRFFFGNRGFTFYSNFLLNVKKGIKYIEGGSVQFGVSVDIRKSIRLLFGKRQTASAKKAPIY